MAQRITPGQRADVAARIAEILVRHSSADLTPEQVIPETALIDSGLDLTSVNLLEALVELEQTLQVRLTDENLTIAALSSFALFVDHVCKLIPEPPQGRA